jgi:hypothetical protein
MELPALLVGRVIVDDEGCWIWQGKPANNGYCRTSLGRGSSKRVAHCVVYELLVGPIPEGFELDHLCHTKECPGGVTDKHRRCVRPDHLAPATRSENCKRGHTGEYATGLPQPVLCVHGSPRTRDCQQCTNERGRRFRERRALVGA